MKKLFTPILINKLELRNRIVIPAMHLNYTMDGHCSEQLIDFYVERHLGGVALSIVGGMGISQASAPFTMPQLKSEKFVPGLERLTSAIHDAGGAVGAQLYDAGAYSHQIGTGVQARSSTAHVSRFTKEPAKEMTQKDIDKTVGEFASAAERAKRTGFDMVEILGSAGYLICQFLSPVINKRTDKYGGSFENRMRFGLEVAAAVRDAVGPDFAVGIRVAGNDFVPGSNTNKETAVFCKAVEPFVDMFNVTGGWHECSVPQLPADLPRGGFDYLARGIKRAVSLPVAASNRINDPHLAEWFLTTGTSDLVCIGRGLIADPEFPMKAEEGRPEDIRPCMSCNQRCFDHIIKMKPVGCMVNPMAGKEGTLTVTPAKTPRSVMIIGAGPAGCEAALTASNRGHRVELYDRNAQLGGQVTWSAMPTGKTEFPTLLQFYETQIEKRDIAVHMNTEVTQEVIAKSEADVVIVATGAEPIQPPIPGGDGPNVVQAWDVLKGEAEVGDKVVIIGGGSVGCETALWLAESGCLSPEQLYFLTIWEAETPETLNELIYNGSINVTVIEMQRKLGLDLGSRRWIIQAKMKKWGVATHTSTTVDEITDKGVICTNKDGDPLFIPADTVLIAAGVKPLNGLYESLKETSDKEIIAVGDCTKPKKIAEAIESGFKAACKI